MKKIILYGAGCYGKEAFDALGRKRIEFFCDASKTGNHCGIPIIDLKKLKEIHAGYNVIVTPVDIAAREEISKILNQNEIPFTFWGGGMHEILHIYGKFPEIYFDFESGTPSFSRAKSTMDMYRRIFSIFSTALRGKLLDIWIYYGDSVQTAYDMSHTLSLPHIHAYSTVWAMRKRVVPIPDYSFYIGGKSNHVLAIDPEKCKESAQKHWSDSRAYWRGTLYNSDVRKWLYCLGKDHPDRLLIESSTGDRKFVSMLEQAKYKYLIGNWSVIPYHRLRFSCHQRYIL